MIASGDSGVFEGAEEDEVVFGRYRREGSWSPGLVGLLTRLLSRGGTLLDIGAHVGLVAIPVAERTLARCLAFEPEPRNFAFLARNVERHGLAHRIETFPCALSSAAGRVHLALSDDNAGDHRVLAPGAPTGGRVIVEVAARVLDDVLDGRVLTAPVVMKLDAQGSEVQVLLGAARALQKVDHVVTEFWPAGLARMGDGVAEFRGALGAFAWGCVLGVGRPLDLVPATELFASLAWIPTDGSDEGFFDLLLSRSPRLPA